MIIRERRIYDNPSRQGLFDLIHETNNKPIKSGLRQKLLHSTTLSFAMQKH